MTISWNDKIREKEQKQKEQVTKIANDKNLEIKKSENKRAND